MNAGRWSITSKSHAIAKQLVVSSEPRKTTQDETLGCVRMALGQCSEWQVIYS